MAAYVTYSWPDSEDRVLSVVTEVEELYRKGLHTDCVLVGGGARFRCHSVMLALVSPMFRDILPQPGEEREDSVLILPDWGAEELKHAVTMLYCGAVGYKAGAKEKVGRLAALMESIGVKGFSVDVLNVELGDVETIHHEEIMEVNQDETNEGLRILDVTTVIEEVKVHSNDQFSKHEKLVAAGDKIGRDALTEHQANQSSEKDDVLKMKAAHSVISHPVTVQCFRCSGDQTSLTEYYSHLLAHQLDTKNCISKLLNKLGKKEQEEDWLCESCYICLLSDQQKVDQGPEAKNALTKHKLACLEEVDREMEVVKLKISKERDETPDMWDSLSSNLVAVEDSPVCDICGIKFKLRIQLNKHKKSCSPSNLPSDTPSTLLGLLRASNWTECPCCWEKMDSAFHLVTHQEIQTLIDDDTPQQEEYRCSDPNHDQLTWTHGMRSSFILHKYHNCTYTAKNCLEKLLDRFTLGDIKVMEESTMDDKETSEDGTEELCVNGDNLENSCGNTSENVSFAGSDNKLRKRRRSGRSTSGEDTLRKSRDPSGESIPRSQKCPQCLRVFHDDRDYQSKGKHFCVRVGNLSQPLKEEMNPTPTKLVTHKCSICVGGPVLASDYHLKRHLILHQGSYFVTELQKRGFDTNKFPSPCFICNKDLSGWEDAITHVGIDHEKLFQALKHDKNNDYRILLKRLFPEKYAKWFSKSKKQLDKGYESKNYCANDIENSQVETSMDTGVSSMEPLLAPQNAVKRKLYIEDSKRDQPDGSFKKVRASSSDSRGVSEEDGSCSKKSKGKCKTMVPKERLNCWICPSHITASYGSKTILYRHMADAHFSDYILTHYPHPLPSTSTSYFPCMFPNCSKSLASLSARVKHLGVVHMQVEKALATPKIVEQAKENAKQDRDTKKQRSSSGSSRSRRGSLDVDNLTCRECKTQFATKESFKLHTCNSLMDKREQECVEGLKLILRTARPSNLRESESLDVSPANEVFQFQSGDSRINLSLTSPTISTAGKSSVASPVKLATSTSLGQLILSDSDEEKSSPKPNLAQIKKKVNELYTSDSDSDNEADDLMFDTQKPSDTPTPPGMELDETVSAVPPIYSCNACNDNFGNATELEMHRKCEKCSSQYGSLIHKTCEKHVTCEYCCKCYNKGVDVHVTCDAFKCKKCFGSEKEKKKHIQDQHSWNDL